MEKEMYRPYTGTLFNKLKVNSQIRKIMGRIIPEIKEIDKNTNNKQYTWASCPECQGLLPVRKWHNKTKAPAVWSFEPAICDSCTRINKAWGKISVLYRGNDGEVFCVTTEKAALKGLITIPDSEQASIIVSLDTARGLFNKVHPLDQH